MGIGAVFQDNAPIGSYALVAAGAVVLGYAVIQKRTLAARVPAKVVRPLTKDERQFLVLAARQYVEHVATYRM
jgi:carbonic anhydrase/acetyltransferase-like protein (isoleucine patch superfamily)